MNKCPVCGGLLRQYGWQVVCENVDCGFSCDVEDISKYYSIENSVPLLDGEK